jgi:hypothetical protein
MKNFFSVVMVLAAGFLVSACGQSDRYSEFEKVMDQQNKTIINQQQSLLDQQQKISDQEVRLTMISDELSTDEAALKRLQDQLVSNEPVPTPKDDSGVNAQKMLVFRQLAGFNGRLSASIGYSAYADGLSDLNSNLAQGLIDIKDQTYIDQVNRILCLYNYAGEFWQHFASDGVTELNITPGDRYRFANVGVNFIDGYQPRQSDVKKFWVEASQELDKLEYDNRAELGQPDSVHLYFAR